MGIPTNGMTAEVFRQAMPPYQLSQDVLAAMFTAIPAPPPNAPQIVIYREAAENAVKRSDAPGITVEQVCRLLRAAAALTVTTAALERSLVRHQQKPVPFFGTVLADGIDIAALAAGWGWPGVAMG